MGTDHAVGGIGGLSKTPNVSDLCLGESTLAEARWTEACLEAAAETRTGGPSLPRGGRRVCSRGRPRDPFQTRSGESHALVVRAVTLRWAAQPWHPCLPVLSCSVTRGATRGHKSLSSGKCSEKLEKPGGQQDGPASSGPPSPADGFLQARPCQLPGRTYSSIPRSVRSFEKDAAVVPGPPAQSGSPPCLSLSPSPLLPLCPTPLSQSLTPSHHWLGSSSPHLLFRLSLTALRGGYRAARSRQVEHGAVTACAGCAASEQQPASHLGLSNTCDTVTATEL